MFWCNFSVKLPWLQRRGNKLNTTLFDRYYFQNCKAITFRKIAIIPNGNKLMFQVIFIFSDWILIEQIIASSHPISLEGNKKFYQEFWVGDWDMSKKAWIQWFSRNVNTINWKSFPTHCRISKLEKT